MDEAPVDRLRSLGGGPVAGGVRLALTLGLAALSALAWTVFLRTHAFPLWATDAFDLAQMGRQLVRGEGFTSLQVFPYVLAWLEEHGHATEPAWANVWRAPLPILAKALAIGLVGDTDLAVQLPGAVYAAGTAAFLFLIGNRVYGVLAGVVAATMWSVSPDAAASRDLRSDRDRRELLPGRVGLAPARDRGGREAQDGEVPGPRPGSSGSGTCSGRTSSS